MDDRLDSKLVDASVPSTATFAEAARALYASGLPAIAVLDERRRVVGLFGEMELLRGLFPRYLGELHHTAFLQDDHEALAALTERVAGESLASHMAPPVTIEADSSSSHLAEKWLHSQTRAIAVVREGEFVGMLECLAFCGTLARRLLDAGTPE